MKLISAFLFPFALAEKTEFCSNGLDASEDEPCNTDDDGFKSFGRSRSMISLINCPEGENSSNSNCQGYTNPKNGKIIPYNNILTQAIRNYGCNCFPNNKKVSNPFNGNPTWIPAANGEPVDELDAHCKIMSKRYVCMKLDFLEKDLHHANPDRAVCDYFQGYNFVHDSDTGEIICGTAKNPNYANDNNGKMPEGIYNMNQCRRARCEMDLELALAVAPLLEDPMAFKSENSGNSDIADDDSKCYFSGSGNGADECCGFPEARSPFSSYTKRCCDNTIVPIGSAEENELC